MPVILMVRHGQASFGKPDYDRLSELGHEQASVLGAALRARLEATHAVYIGEMRRHRETAEGCLDAMGASAEGSPFASELRIAPGLNEFDARDMIRKHDPLGLERLATGVKILRDRKARAHFEALFSKAMQRWTSGAHDEDYEVPWREFADRCERAVEDIARATGRGETALAFTSAGPISAVAQRCLGLPAERVQALNQMIVNASVTKLVVGEGPPRLSTFNDHAALERLGRRLITYR